MVLFYLDSFFSKIGIFYLGCYRAEIAYFSLLRIVVPTWKESKCGQENGSKIRSKKVDCP